MINIGFIISHKNNERRRALLPGELKDIANVGRLCFEEGYGESVGYRDEEYAAMGARIVSRREALSCDAIVDVKLGDADFLEEIAPGRLLIGWAHAVQKVDFTSAAIRGGHTVLAWEEIYDRGRYIFYKNREIAGEAAILHGFRYSGKMPYDARVAIIGNGQTSKGAYRILAGLGAEVDIYSRKHERYFRQHMEDYDVLVNCVMWDTSRTDRLIYKEDLKRLRKGTLIIDVSCDPEMEIETSHATTIDDPVYEVDGIIHYAVDNTPAMFPHTVTHNLSRAFAPYVDGIVTGEYPKGIRQAIVIDAGRILDNNIIRFRQARGLFCQ